VWVVKGDENAPAWCRVHQESIDRARGAAFNAAMAAGGGLITNRAQQAAGAAFFATLRDLHPDDIPRLVVRLPDLQENRTPLMVWRNR
jgi:hypothetical protein